MIPLTIIVDSLGGWLALGFILVFIVKAFLSAIGGDVDIDTDNQSIKDASVINFKDKHTKLIVR